MLTRLSPAVRSANCFGAKSVRLPSLPSCPSYQVTNSSRDLRVGHRDFESRQMRASNQSFVDLGQAVAQETDRDIMPFDIGVLGPGQEPHQTRGPNAAAIWLSSAEGTRYWA